MMRAPAAPNRRSVVREARMRVSSPTPPAESGTFRSARTKTRFPRTPPAIRSSRLQTVIVRVRQFAIFAAAGLGLASLSAVSRPVPLYWPILSARSTTRLE